MQSKDNVLMISFIVNNGLVQLHSLALHSLPFSFGDDQPFGHCDTGKGASKTPNSYTNKISVIEDQNMAEINNIKFQ